MNARQVAEQVLDVTWTGDPEWFVSRMAPDGVVEWPYRPEGVPERLTGREEIRAFMATGMRLITFEEYRDKVIHETTDPEVVIVEYSAHGRVSASGAPFAQRVIAVIRVRDGLIAHYRDYVNPLPLMEALRSSADRAAELSDLA